MVIELITFCCFYSCSCLPSSSYLSGSNKYYESPIRVSMKRVDDSAMRVFSYISLPQDTLLYNAISVLLNKSTKESIGTGNEETKEKRT